MKFLEVRSQEGDRLSVRMDMISSIREDGEAVTTVTIGDSLEKALEFTVPIPYRILLQMTETGIEIGQKEVIGQPSPNGPFREITSTVFNG